VIVIVFGVSGAGKTTIGKLLTQGVGWRFYEADDFHSQANIDKLRRGIPLTDEDRWPWLESLRQLIKRSLEAGENAVLACSALKRAYREQLRVSDEVKFVFLHGDYALIEKQLRQRRGHFMNPELLRSQFTDLEEPKSDEDVLTIELRRTPQKIVDEIKAKLHLAGKEWSGERSTMD
jgi:gluconokinase